MSEANTPPGTQPTGGQVPGQQQPPVGQQPQSQQQPPAGSNTNQPQAGATQQQGNPQADEPMTLQEARKIRRENQKLRQMRDEFLQAQQKAQDEKLTENERLNKRIKELEGQVSSLSSAAKEREAKDKVLGIIGTKYKAKNPAAVYKLIKDDIEFSDDGTVENLDEVIKQAKQDYAELFTERPRGPADGGNGSRQQPQGSDFNATIRAQAGYGPRQ